MKFKVGDTVRVKSAKEIREYPSYGGDEYRCGADSFMPQMFRFCDKLAVITGFINENEYSLRFGGVEQDWCWTDEMLKKSRIPLEE